MVNAIDWRAQRSRVEKRNYSTKIRGSSDSCKCIITFHKEFHPQCYNRKNRSRLDSKIVAILVGRLTIVSTRSSSALANNTTQESCIEWIKNEQIICQEVSRKEKDVWIRWKIHSSWKSSAIVYVAQAVSAGFVSIVSVTVLISFYAYFMGGCLDESALTRVDYSLAWWRLSQKCGAIHDGQCEWASPERGESRRVTTQRCMSPVSEKLLYSTYGNQEWQVAPLNLFDEWIHGWLIQSAFWRTSS